MLNAKWEDGGIYAAKRRKDRRKGEMIANDRPGAFQSSRRRLGPNTNQTEEEEEEEEEDAGSG